MAKKAEAFVVILIAIVALISLVFLFMNYFQDTLVGKAIAGTENNCHCTTMEKPVCGDDLQTYRNLCYAACNGVSVFYNGPCN